MNRLLSLLCVAALTVSACTHSGPDKTHGDTKENVPPLVSLCRAVDYADTAALHDRKTMERVMRGIVKLLPATDSLSAHEALFLFFSGIGNDEKAMGTAAELAELYLNNPASPVRNETLYIRLLRAMLSVRELPFAVRTRAEDRLKTACLNRPGSVATDFRFIDREGNRLSLHLLQGAEYLLLFYDPECSHCQDILNRIAEDPRIRRAVAEKALTVLAIYAEGKRDVWERTKHDLPDSWLVGYDLSGILDNGLYALPAMPVIYLLDADKRVVLKDPNVTTLLP